MPSITKIAFLAVGAMAVVVGAQDFTSFPNCAQWCITSMQQSNKSQELGCSTGDNGCLCRNPNFTYGVRDCSAELCANATTAEMALGYVNNFCQSNGVQLSTVTTGLPASFTGGAGGGAASGSVAISTEVFTSTITTDGSTITTTGTSTIFGTANPVASASEVVSTIVSEGSTFVSTLTGSVVPTASDATATGEPTASATDGEASSTASGTSTSVGFAPQLTAAPAGVLAIVGVAAFLL